MGEVFAGRYEVTAVLGAGGMGAVYQARDRELGRSVALKVMSDVLSRDPLFRSRFRREASSAAAVDHPNVARVWHADAHADELYVVMQLIEGSDLGQELEAQGRLDPARTVRLVGDMAAGLDAVHRAGLVHRDIKPGNILLLNAGSAGERAVLVDFGLARPTDGSQAVTNVGEVLGTAAYMSPEQVRGEDLTAQSDVYALACVAYHCLAGEPPFAAGSAMAVALARETTEPADVRTHAPDVPAGIAAALRTGLAKDLAVRHHSAGAFAADLAAGDVPSILTRAGGAPTTRLVPTRGPALDAPTVVAPPGRGPRRRALWAVPAALAAASLVAAGWLALRDQTPTGVVPSATPTSTAAPWQQLAERLPASVFTDCRRVPPTHPETQLGAVTCTAAGGGAGAPDQLLAVRWRDVAAMRTDFVDKYVAKYPDGTCASTWNVSSTWRGGALACYRNSRGADVVMYEFGSMGEPVQILAINHVAGRSKMLYDWWLQAATIPLL
jgi:serine/threonine-protein kinase